MNAVASELRHLRGELVRVNRKLALSRIPIKITDVRERDDDWQVRGELGEDPKTGTKVLTPWVRVQPASSGELKIKTKPTKGQQMYLFSGSGVVGADSLAIWGAFDQDNKPPKGQDDLIIERGQTRIALNEKTLLATAPDKATMKSGDAEVELKPGAANLVGGKVHTVGETHLGVDAKDGTAEKDVVVKGLLDTPRVFAKSGPPDPKVAELETAIAAAADGGGGGDA